MIDSSQLPFPARGKKWQIKGKESRRKEMIKMRAESSEKCPSQVKPLLQTHPAGVTVPLLGLTPDSARLG